MKVKVNRLCLILLLVLCSSILAGCWDYNETENRGYVLGIAIDDVSVVDKDTGYDGDYNREIEEMELEEGKPKYAYTIQIPIISRAEIKPTGQGGGAGGNKKKVWNLTVAGNSLFEAERECSTRIDYPPFFEHIQAIVISEEVARAGVIESFDMLIRDPEMRRRVKVFVTPGEARKAFDIEPKLDDYSAIYIASLTENSTKTSKMPHKTDLGKMAAALHEKRAFILPRLKVSEEEVKYAGGAVFKDGKMLGWLDEKDISYLEWASNTVRGGTIVVHMPDHRGGLVTLEIYSVNTKVRPNISDGNITLNIKSNAKVHIAEEFRDEFYSTFDEDFVGKLERAAEEKVEKGMSDVIKYVQSQYGADVFSFYKSMERYAPDTWDRVKDNWDDVFKNVKINIDVNVKVVQRGIIK